MILTFTIQIWTKPLSSIVVEKTFRVSETHNQVTLRKMNSLKEEKKFKFSFGGYLDNKSIWGQFLREITEQYSDHCVKHDQQMELGHRKLTNIFCYQNIFHSVIVINQNYGEGVGGKNYYYDTNLPWYLQ